MIPDIQKTTAEVQAASQFVAVPENQATQTVGCIYCAMMGEVTVPEVIYHYQGTSYCLDHMMQASSQIGNE